MMAVAATTQPVPVALTDSLTSLALALSGSVALIRLALAQAGRLPLPLGSH